MNLFRWVDYALQLPLDIGASPCTISCRVSAGASSPRNLLNALAVLALTVPRGTPMRKEISLWESPPKHARSITSLCAASSASRALDTRHDSQDSSTTSCGPAELSLMDRICESPLGMGLTPWARLRCRSTATLRVTLKSQVEKLPREGSKVCDERHTLRKTS